MGELSFTVTTTGWSDLDRARRARSRLLLRAGLFLVRAGVRVRVGGDAAQLPHVVVALAPVIPYAMSAEAG